MDQRHHSADDDSAPLPPWSNSRVLLGVGIGGTLIFIAAAGFVGGLIVFLAWVASAVDKM